MSETTEEWMRRIGSHEALEYRQRERLAGRMNKLLSRGGAVQKVMSAPAASTAQEKPKTIIPETSKGFKQPKKKWDEQRGRSSN